MMRRHVLVVGAALLAVFTGGVVAMRGAIAGPVPRTVAVGARPVALAVDERTERVFVANYDDDSVSILDAGSGDVPGTIAVNGPPGAVAWMRGPATGTWGWAPQWLHQWLSGLPWLPHQSMDNDSANGSVSMLDATR